MRNEAIVSISGLTVDFDTIDGTLHVLSGVDFEIQQGEVIGVVGETGCGKSVTAKFLLGILPMPPGVVRGGEAHLMGKDLLSCSARDREALKQHIAYIPQDPMMSLNPVFSVGTLMVDMIVWQWSNRQFRWYVCNKRKKDIRSKAEAYASELLDKVHIPDPKPVLKKYALELSGGMRQRVLLAMALIGTPRLLIADEPTTALDVTIQKRTLHLIKEKVKEEELSGLYITHNLGVANIICDRIYVMYAGTVVESGPTKELLKHPLHPYTKGLIKSVPRLTGDTFTGIDGQVPDYLSPPSGCRFHLRCPHCTPECAIESPKQIQTERGRFVACRLFY